jgi:HAD superfamily hydrolase (TIGR01484 family)
MFSDVLLTVDVDRTLTGPDSKIPERNIEAIRYFTENGGMFTVNTGRSLNTYRGHMQIVPANAPLLLFNGAAAYFEGQWLRYQEIDLDMWEILLQVRKEFPNMNLELQALDCHYLIDPTPEFKRMYDGMQWPYKIPETGADLGPFVKFALFDNPTTDTVGCLYEGTPEQLAEVNRIEARILELWGHKVDTTRSAPRIIDVQAKGVSKGQSAKLLQQELRRKILVCVGDAENDITMMEAADFAFCPAESVIEGRYPSVCNCGEGAVADVIYKKIPEILSKLP